MSTPPPPSPPASGTPDEGLAALERLRKRVEDAAAEIERLRKENAELAKRMEKLAAHEVARGDALPALAIGGDPDALREQIEGFIESIDRMLVVSDASGPDASSPEDDGGTSESTA